MQNDIFKVSAKNLRGGQQKMNLILSTIRGCSIDVAETNLRFSKKRNAEFVLKATRSCVANMQNNHGVQDFNNFYVKEAYVGKGMKIKRFVARAKGRIFPVQKTFSHFTIIIEKVKR